MASQDQHYIVRSTLKGKPRIQIIQLAVGSDKRAEILANRMMKVEEVFVSVNPTTVDEFLKIHGEMFPDDGVDGTEDGAGGMEPGDDAATHTEKTIVANTFNPVVDEAPAPETKPAPVKTPKTVAPASAPAVN